MSRVVRSMRGGVYGIRIVLQWCFRIYTRLLALVFPISCVLCDRECVPATLLCSSCKNSFCYAKSDMCFSCFRNPSLQPYSLCCMCWRSRIMKRVVFLQWFCYSPIRQLLYQFKYSSCFLYASLFTRLLCEQKNMWPSHKHLLFIPVPLSQKRRRWRGYNQSALFALTLAEQLGFSYASLLSRTHHSVLQSSLTRMKRFENARGLYAVRENDVCLLQSYHHIVLVDDVFTTGATLEECARVLRAAGFQGVIEGCVVAIEPPAFFQESDFHKDTPE